VSEEHAEEFIWHVIISNDTLFLLSKVMRERRFEVDRPRSEDYLVTIDRLAFDHQSDVTEVGLVENAEKVFLVHPSVRH